MTQLSSVETAHEARSETTAEGATAWIDAPDTVRCPHWCGGKHNETHPDDRVHWSSNTLAFDPVLAEPAFERVDDETHEIPLRLLITMEQGFREVGPRISVAPEILAHGKGFAFTVTEAERVAHEMLRLIEASHSTANR
ncbi:hypothetical protein Amsp01_048430 [Amycolatopsis sp. NBRC 101858]|uniref:DUF6907 domain-containing protein n=1 Tax=Amycolatopsis sp. NBRC 101858 TaxID=3032200 RepID=UPI0024A25F9C|nr:hypothetical protein [Amycolatopsis sp. NBRC 101858]GLY38819.1 hypothetical protein Amsp01_048430 [Amycolatopsis sp. NBRC 101858]